MGTPNLNKSETVKLEFPVELDGTNYAELTARRPRIADNVWADKQKGTELERGLAMLARLCDVPPEVIHELDDLDAERLQDKVNSFRGR